MFWFLLVYWFATLLISITFSTSLFQVVSNLLQLSSIWQQSLGIEEISRIWPSTRLNAIILVLFVAAILDFGLMNSLNQNIYGINELSIQKYIKNSYHLHLQEFGMKWYNCRIIFGSHLGFLAYEWLKSINGSHNWTTHPKIHRKSGITCLYKNVLSNVVKGGVATAAILKNGGKNPLFPNILNGPLESFKVTLRSI